ncbi:MAG: hypothetical protein HY644_08185 [Acidobacteria bacterium]|nr:hypothetical protein [Acidobacteriota bacterium]
MSTPNSTPPPSSPTTPSPGDSNRTVMIVLSYLWLLALIPFVLEKTDTEVRWHSRHGLVLTAAELIVWIALSVLAALPFLGIIAGCGMAPLLWILFLIIHVLAIVKGLKGERLIIPGISQYADKF